MISHSSSVSLPGLLMISLETRSLPMSCSSDPNSSSRRSTSERPHLVGDGHGHHHDAVAVLAAGVLIVGRHDVVHQQRRAAVGGRELQRVADVLVALAGEVADQPRDGHDAQDGPWVLDHDHGGEEAERRQADVHAGDLEVEAQVQRRSDAQDGPLAHEAAAEVEGQLGQDGQGEDPEGVGRGGGGAGDAEHQADAHRVPRVGHGDQQPQRVGAPQRDLGQPPQERAGDHVDGQQRGRDGEGERDQDQLGRAGVARADVEAHAPDRRVRDEQERHHAGRGAALRRRTRRP